MPEPTVLPFRRRCSLQDSGRNAVAAIVLRSLPLGVSAQKTLTNDTFIAMPKAPPRLRKLGLLICVGSLFLDVAVSQVSDKNYRVLDDATIARFKNSGAEPTVMLDLNLARLKPSLISDDQPFLNYFIMLNNCGDMGMFRALKSEFDYPAMAGFYKGKAPEILRSLSLPVGVMSPIYFLGDYDATRKSFPFVGFGRAGAPRKPVKLDSLTIGADRGGLPCGNAVQVATSVRLNGVLSNLGPVYIVKFRDNNEFAELPMDEAHAREYVDGLRGGPRMVTLLIDFEVLPQAPTSTTVSGVVNINLAGQIKKVTAVKTAARNVVLATLYP